MYFKGVFYDFIFTFVKDSLENDINFKDEKMSTIEIDLYNRLKSKIGEAEAKELLEFIDFRSEQKRSEADKMLATKEDINNVRLEIKESKTDMIKWFFAFFITLVLMILGLFATILLK